MSLETGRRMQRIQKLRKEIKDLQWEISDIYKSEKDEGGNRKAMREAATYFPINELRDTRSKHDRIIQGIKGPASNRAIHIQRHHSEFIEQFENFPNVTHDDVLDMSAMCFLKFPMFGIGMNVSQGRGEHKGSNVRDIQSGARAGVRSRPILRHGAP